MDYSLVLDAQPVLKARTIQPLVQTIFDAPVLSVGLEEGFGRQVLRRTAGHNVFDFQLGVLAGLPMQAPDLGGSSQAQLNRLNLPCGQRAPLAPAAIVFDPHYLRGERSPAGGVAQLLLTHLGYL